MHEVKLEDVKKLIFEYYINSIKNFSTAPLLKDIQSICINNDFGDITEEDKILILTCIFQDQDNFTPTDYQKKVESFLIVITEFFKEQISQSNEETFYNMDKGRFLTTNDIETFNNFSVDKKTQYSLGFLISQLDNELQKTNMKTPLIEKFYNSIFYKSLEIHTNITDKKNRHIKF